MSHINPHLPAPCPCFGWQCRVQDKPEKPSLEVAPTTSRFFPPVTLTLTYELDLWLGQDESSYPVSFRVIVHRHAHTHTHTHTHTVDWQHYPDRCAQIYYFSSDQSTTETDNTDTNLSLPIISSVYPPITVAPASTVQRSAIGQPTWPTQPFILSGSINE